MKRLQVVVLTIVCFILGLSMSWQYKSMKTNKTIAILETKRVSELQDEIIREKQNNEMLRQRLNELQEDNLQYTNSQSDRSELTQALENELDLARTIAGLTTVKGSGVVVIIDSDGPVYVEEKHIINVINELRASGAQAISINDERITALSEVRSAGRYILVNGRQLMSPFVIKAIANPEKLENSLKIIGGVIEKLELYKIDVEVKTEDNVIIPKVRDDGTVLKTDKLIPIEK